MIADFCSIGCDEIYEDECGWKHTGKGQPSLFIGTEQDKSEIQTMMLAFLSNVNEDHILNGLYLEGEEERVRHAAEVILKNPVYIEELPDFSLQDVENVIKKNIREHDVLYCFFDYVMTSMKILEEVTKRSGGVKLREDNVLFMLSNRLKDLCNKYGIFILTATQLNGNFREEKVPDQNLLRGAKSIADVAFREMALVCLRLKARRKKIVNCWKLSLRQSATNLPFGKKFNDYPLWSSNNEV